MIEWWAYVHENGGIHVKRFHNSRDVKEAEESTFVRKVVGPYVAQDRIKAVTLAHRMLGIPTPIDRSRG